MSIKGITIGGKTVKDLTLNGGTVFHAGGGEPPVLLSWEHVLWSIEQGSYATDYAIGDLIPLDLGTEGNINMQIAAFDADDLASGSGKAHISFISKELLNTSHRMNPSTSGTSGGWEMSEMRAYMKETIKPLIRADVRSAILEVTKTSYDLKTGPYYQQTTQDDVWIPSTRDLAYSNKKETSGPMYSEMFPDIESHKKYKVGSTSDTQFWLRSVGNSSSYFCYVASESGNWISYGGVSGSYGVALGFCL